MNKDNLYEYPLELKKHLIQEQIAEAQHIIYRNDVENLTFTANNEKARIKEVEVNNETLREKLDILWVEWERLDEEDKARSNSAI